MNDRVPEKRKGSRTIRRDITSRRIFLLSADTNITRFTKNTSYVFCTINAYEF